MEDVIIIIALLSVCCLTGWTVVEEIKRARLFAKKEETLIELLEAVLRKVEEIDG